MNDQHQPDHKSEDLFDGWLICSACNLEHEYSKRVVWSFPWGYRHTRCPRCGCQDIDYPESKSTESEPVYI